MSEQDLGGRAARGAAVTIGGQAFRVVIQLVSVAVLARLLGDYAYGLFGMLVPIIGLGELFRDFGLSQAAVQARHVSASQRSNLFWINTGIGAVVTVACVLAAPLAGMYFKNDEVVPLLRVMSIVFLLNGMTAQYRAIMVRSMRFKALALMDCLTPLLAFGCALALALNGAGAWALVGQQLTVGVVTFALVAGVTRWIPGRPRRGVPMREFLRFGFGLFGSQLLGYLANNVDSLIIGRRFSTQVLGQYTRAFSLLMTPLNQLRAPSTTVALPTLSRLRNDQARFNRFVRSGQTALGLPTGVLMVLVSGAAYPLIEMMLGSGWQPAASVLQFLALAGMFETLAYVGYWVYLARAKTQVLAKYTAVVSVLRIACVVVGSNWGIVGVAAAYTLIPMLSWPLSLWWLGRATPVPVRELMWNGLRIVVMGVPIWFATRGTTLATAGLPLAGQLALSLGAGLAVAALILGLIPVYRREVGEIRKIVHLMLSSRKGKGPAGAVDATEEGSPAEAADRFEVAASADAPASAAATNRSEASASTEVPRTS